MHCFQKIENGHAEVAPPIHGSKKKTMVLAPDILGLPLQDTEPPNTARAC